VATPVPGLVTLIVRLIALPMSTAAGVSASSCERGRVARERIEASQKGHAGHAADFGLLHPASLPWPLSSSLPGRVRAERPDEFARRLFTRSWPATPGAWW